MAGPSPHVPPPPLVPHTVPPLTSSSSCPDPRSALSPTPTPLQISDHPRSEHLQPSSPHTDSDPPPHPPPPPPLPNPSSFVAIPLIRSSNPFPPLPPRRPTSSTSSALPISASSPLPPPPQSSSLGPHPHQHQLLSSSPLPQPLSFSQATCSATIPPPPVHSSSATATGLVSHPTLSFAQATRNPRGTGFVRSHASDVESFARLPRTGVNIICGSKEGIPSFSFVSSDLQTVENIYSNALVMKFHGGRPSLEVSHREILSWGLEHPFSIGPLTSRAFLLRFQDNKDLIRVLSRPSSILITFPYKVFRWHNLCHLKEDSCYAPVWISLPRLPLQCFIPEFLESVANKIGRFLCFDKATSTLARPSAARFCVELDLRTPPPPFIWVGLFEGLKQPIIYEKMPSFCNICQVQGHSAIDCPKGQRETPILQAGPRSTPILERPQGVRQNATRHSSTWQKHSKSIPTSVPNPTTHPPPYPTISPNPSPQTAPLQRMAEVLGDSTNHQHLLNLDANATHEKHLLNPKLPSATQPIVGSDSASPLNQTPIQSLHSTPDLASADGTPSVCPLLNSSSNPFAVLSSSDLNTDASAIGTDLELVDHGSATSSCNLNAGVSEEKRDLVPLNSDECTSQSSGPPGFSSKNTNFKEVNLDKEDSTSQSSGPPGFSTKISKTKKKHSSKGGTVFSHRTHLKHFATSKKSSATSKGDNPNSTPFLPINALSSDNFASIASNCGIKLPLSSDCFARLKALEIERSGADR